MASSFTRDELFDLEYAVKNLIDDERSILAVDRHDGFARARCLRSRTQTWHGRLELLCHRRPDIILQCRRHIARALIDLDAELILQLLAHGFGQINSSGRACFSQVVNSGFIVIGL